MVETSVMTVEMVRKMYRQGHHKDYLVRLVKHHFKQKSEAQAFVDHVIYHELTGRWIS